MNGYIHICLLVIFSPPSILYIQKSQNHSHQLFPENSAFFLLYLQWNGSTVTRFRGKNTQCPLFVLLFASHCVPSPHLFSVHLHHIPVQTLLPFAKAVKPDFTLVFLSLSFLNSVLHNRAKLILSSVLWLFSLSRLHPQKIWDPWGYDSVSFIFLFFFYILT